MKASILFKSKGINLTIVDSFVYSFVCLKKKEHADEWKENRAPLHYDHTWNHRKVTDGEQTMAAIQRAEGKRLIYARCV